MDSFASISKQVHNGLEEEKSHLKEELSRLASQSQFHGIPRLLSRNTPLKLFWAIFILASTGLCFYAVINNIQLYLEFNVDTLVQMVPQHSLELPVISICNSNPFITNSGFEYFIDYYKETYNVTFSNFSEFYTMIENKRIPDDRDWIFYKTFESATFDAQVTKSFGFRFEEQTLLCQTFFEPCRRDEFVQFYHPKYGNCFRFNTGFSSNGTYIGKRSAIIEEYGLQMAVFTGLNDFFFQNGLVIMIDNQLSKSIDKKGILIRPGTWANLALRKTKSENLPQPYNDCRNDDFRDTFLAQQLRKYGRRNCMSLCRQMMIIEKLGCYDMRYPNLNTTSNPCTDKSTFNKLKSIDLDMSRCDVECPFECQTTIYDWDISYARFPNYRSYKIINNSNYYNLQNLFSNRSYSYSDFQKSIAGFFVYYDPLTVVEISQSPSMEFVDLLANIGGLLGLFLGLSLLSLVEFLELFLVLFEAGLRLFKNNPNNEKKKTKKRSFGMIRKWGYWPDIREELKRCGELSTINGIPNILSTKRRYVKSIWAFFFVLSIILFTIMIVRQISIYLEFDLATQIRQVRQQSIKFPTIQICNPNYFVTKEATGYLKEFYWENYGRNFSNFDELFEYTNETSFRWFNSAFYKTFAADFNLTLKRSFTHSLDDLLITCLFDSKPCNRSWFDWFSHPIFGNCFKFNSGFLNGSPNAVEVLNVDRPNAGLYMELFTGLPDDYFNDYLYEYMYNAINIYVSDQGHLPIDKLGRPFEPGKSAWINLALSRFVNLPASNCQYGKSIESDIVSRMRRFNMSYDRYNCITLCQQMLAQNASGCHYMPYPNIFGGRECETLEEGIRNRNANFDDSLCADMCPGECEQHLYSYQVSFLDFPSQNYAYKRIHDNYSHFNRLFQNRNISFDMFKKSVSSFYFYFDELAITEAIESPATEFVDLIANIGGILGLFIGLSFLSFVEIFEITIRCISILIHNKPNEYYN